MAIVTSKTWKGIALGAILLVIVFVGWRAWQKRHRSALPEGIAMGNGRLEAIQVDVATQVASRVADVLVDERDHVEAGQVLARMNTASLLAQLHEAEALSANAASGKVTALATVAATCGEHRRSCRPAAPERRESRPGAARSLDGAPRTRRHSAAAV